MSEEEFRERCAIRAGDNALRDTAGSSHDHGNCELCDLLEREREADRAAISTLADALNALTIWSQNGSQLCYRSHNDIPMGMSKKQERLARAALDVLIQRAQDARAGEGKRE